MMPRKRDKAQEIIMDVYEAASKCRYEIELEDKSTGERIKLDDQTARACLRAGIILGAVILEDVREFQGQDPRGILLYAMKHAAYLYLEDMGVCPDMDQKGDDDGRE